MLPAFEPVEDDDFYFDPVAANRPIEFGEEFCRHYEGKHAGNAFVLEAIQKTIVKDIYGYKHRSGEFKGFRRFNEVYFEAAAGAGKSPLGAMLGLFSLVADGEEGAQIYSLASDYSQARIIFDTAKKMIDASPELSDILEVTDKEIRYPGANSWWRIIAGNRSKGGAKPHAVLADEYMDWQYRGAYDALKLRMAKRQQPIWFGFTNSGTSRSSLCWQLHEEAVAVLTGKKKNNSLYPIIWAADDNEMPGPEAWRKANKLIGVTISEQKISDDWENSKGNPELEARHRRLYLSQWGQAAKRWLKMDQWDACSSPKEDDFKPETLMKCPLYLGIDMSLGDDLCAVVFVWVREGRFYVRSRFWIPRQTAEYYDLKYGTSYLKGWKQNINIIEASTVEPEQRVDIAKMILQETKGHNLKLICFDSTYAEDCIRHLETVHPDKCLSVRQGWTLSPACFELERRLKAGTIVIEPNAVLRANAENVQIITDSKGNIWPGKPNANAATRYSGRREAKIDGISSLATAITEAMKHSFAAKQSTAKAWII